MNKCMRGLIWGFAATGFAAAPSVFSDEGKAAYYAAADNAAADYRVAYAVCETLGEGSAQIVCIEEAKLAQTRAKGTAEAQYRKTAQARQKAATDIANAEYAVAKARCEGIEYNDKSACIRHASALRAAALAKAKDHQMTTELGVRAR